MDLSKIREIITIIKRIKGRKIVTISTDNFSEVFEIGSDGHIGFLHHHSKLFIKDLSNAIMNGGGIIIRQYTNFTREELNSYNRIIKVPYKNIYGILLFNGEIILQKSQDVQKAYCTCQKTGEISIKEKGIFFKSLAI